MKESRAANASNIQSWTGLAGKMPQPKVIIADAILQSGKPWSIPTLEFLDEMEASWMVGRKNAKRSAFWENFDLGDQTNRAKLVKMHANQFGKKLDDVVLNMRTILRVIGGPHIRGSTLLIKPKHCVHGKVGTSPSPINKTEAAIIKKIIRQLFENGACSKMATEDTPARRCSILITTPYQEQAQLIRQTIGQLMPIYAAKNLVDVRTMTAAQGHDADISIHGATRGDGKGLANDKKKLAVVAESRAKWLSIYIVAEDAVTQSELQSIDRYCKVKDAVAAQEYWSDMTCNARVPRRDGGKLDGRPEEHKTFSLLGEL